MRDESNTGSVGQGCVLVTGACGGIGQAIVTRCLAKYSVVFANSRNAEKLDRCCAHWGDRVIPLLYDVTDEAAVKQIFRDIQKKISSSPIGPFYGLVNAAGVMHESALAATPLAVLREQLDINLIAPYHHIQYASRLMARHKSGSIVNIVSQVGELGCAGMSAYAASKAGLTGLTRSLAKELAPLNICVNAVSPGFIRTAMTAHYDENTQAKVVDRVTLGRAGEAQEVAAAVCYLLGVEAGYVTGQVLAVDGGFSP